MLTSNFSYDEYEYDHYYDYDYDPNLSSIPLEELVVPLLIYSITFTIGLLGNTLILVAVRGQKQVWQIMIDGLPPSEINMRETISIPKPSGKLAKSFHHALTSLFATALPTHISKLLYSSYFCV